jgi:hypothetical protein
VPSHDECFDFFVDVAAPALSVGVGVGVDDDAALVVSLDDDDDDVDDATLFDSPFTNGATVAVGATAGGAEGGSWPTIGVVVAPITDVDGAEGVPTTLDDDDDDDDVVGSVITRSSILKPVLQSMET